MSLMLWSAKLKTRVGFQSDVNCIADTIANQHGVMSPKNALTRSIDTRDDDDNKINSSKKTINLSYKNPLKCKNKNIESPRSDDKPLDEQDDAFDELDTIDFGAFTKDLDLDYAPPPSHLTGDKSYNTFSVDLDALKNEDFDNITSIFDEHEIDLSKYTTKPPPSAAAAAELVPVPGIVPVPVPVAAAAFPASTPTPTPAPVPGIVSTASLPGVTASTSLPGSPIVHLAVPKAPKAKKRNTLHVRNHGMILL